MPKATLIYVEFEECGPHEAIYIETGSVRPGTLGGMFAFDADEGGNLRCVEYYDINLCKASNQFLVHHSGSGGTIPVEVQAVHYVDKKLKHRYWAHPELVRIVRTDDSSPEERLESIPADLSWLVDHNFSRYEEGKPGVIEAEIVYCTVCDDHFSDEATCEHIYWDDDKGCWSGPGYVE